MSEEQTGWGAPPVEAQEAPEAVVPQEAEAQEAPEEQGELILGKFKSQEDLVEAYRRAEAERGRLANELGQARKVTEEQPPILKPQNINPDEVMDIILRTPPSQLAREVGPWDNFVAQSMGWDPQTMDSADWVEAKNVLRSHVEQRQAQARAEQQQVQQVINDFFTRNEDLGDWKPLVAQTEAELIQAGRTWTSFEEYERDVATAARERIGKLAATWMGRQGGKAAAQSRVVPGGGVAGSGGQVGNDDLRYRVGWRNPDA